MVDALWSYSPSSHRKYISSSEIQRMKKAMKKVPVLQLQWDIYHEKEETEAEKLLWWLTEIPSNSELWQNIGIDTLSDKHRWNRIIQYFTSLFTA